MPVKSLHFISVPYAYLAQQGCGGAVRPSSQQCRKLNRLHVVELAYMPRQTCEISMWRPVSHCCFSLESAGRGDSFAVGQDSARCKTGLSECENLLFTVHTHTHTHTNRWNFQMECVSKCWEKKVLLFGQGLPALITALFSSHDHCCFCRTLWEFTQVQVTKWSHRWWEGQPRLQYDMSREEGSLS